MNDDEFLQAFLDCSLPHEQFRHRDHLRLAWILTRRFAPKEARVAMADGVRRFAAFHGHSSKYHETLTHFWMLLILHMHVARPDIEEFDQLLVTFPQLADKQLPLHHWSTDTLFSATARAAWVEPDIRALAL